MFAEINKETKTLLQNIKNKHKGMVSRVRLMFLIKNDLI